MKPLKGKRPVLWIVASGLLALPIAAVFLRDSLVEGYHIYMLGSSDPKARLTAVEELMRRKSVRAVPHLVRLLKDAPDERVEFGSDDVGQLSGGEVHLTPILHAIHSIGQPGRPALEAAIRENAEDWLPGQYNIAWLLTHVTRAWDRGSVARRLLYSGILDDGL